MRNLLTHQSCVSSNACRRPDLVTWPRAPEVHTGSARQSGTQQLALQKSSKFSGDRRRVEAPSDVKLGASITLPSAELGNNVCRVFCPVKREAS